MSTVEKPHNSAITSEAMHLLDEFASQLNDVIYEIAESIAEANGNVDEHGVVQISLDEIRTAADGVLAAVQSQTGTPLPQAVRQQIERSYKELLDKYPLRGQGD